MPMHVNTGQEATFPDDLIEVPSFEFDVLDKIIDGQAVSIKLWEIISNDEDGLAESVVTAPANESEMTNFSEVVKQANLKPGQKVLYDKGVNSKAKRRFLKREEITGRHHVKKSLKVRNYLAGIN